MAFIPQNELEEDLIKVASDPTNEEYSKNFYAKLVVSDLYIIAYGSVSEEDGSFLTNEGDNIAIVNTEIDGEIYTPIFTSLPRIDEFVKEQVGYIAMNAVTMFSMIKDLEVILNPGSDYGKHFTREEIESIGSSSSF